MCYSFKMSSLGFFICSFEEWYIKGSQEWWSFENKFVILKTMIMMIFKLNFSILAITTIIINGNAFEEFTTNSTTFDNDDDDNSTTTTINYDDANGRSLSLSSIIASQLIISSSELIILAQMNFEQFLMEWVKRILERSSPDSTKPSFL